MSKLILKNVNKKYDKHYVYHNFNLTINDKGITVVLGPSGCGKTTMLNMIAGLAKYSGKITKVKCSYVLQDPALVPSLTVYENLLLVCKDEKKINQTLKEFELTEKKNQYPINLSQGQKHRVSIARALVYDSDYILMDEPFSTLDIKLRIKLMNLFANLVNKYNKAAIVVTHDVEEAIVLGNRVIVMNEGKNIYDKKISSPIPRTYGSNHSIRQELIKQLLK